MACWTFPQRPWETGQNAAERSLQTSAQPALSRFPGSLLQSWVLVPACVGLEQKMKETRRTYFQGLLGSPYNPWSQDLPIGLARNQVSYYWTTSKQKMFDKLTFLKGEKRKKKGIIKNSWPALTGRTHLLLLDTLMFTAPVWYFFYFTVMQSRKELYWNHPCVKREKAASL